MSCAPAEPVQDSSEHQDEKSEETREPIYNKPAVAVLWSQTLHCSISALVKPAAIIATARLYPGEVIPDLHRETRTGNKW